MLCCATYLALSLNSLDGSFMQISSFVIDGLVVLTQECSLSSAPGDYAFVRAQGISLVWSALEFH